MPGGCAPIQRQLLRGYPFHRHVTPGCSADHDPQCRRRQCCCRRYRCARFEHCVRPTRAPAPISHIPTLCSTTAPHRRHSLRRWVAGPNSHPRHRGAAMQDRAGVDRDFAGQLDGDVDECLRGSSIVTPASIQRRLVRARSSRSRAPVASVVHAVDFRGVAISTEPRDSRRRPHLDDIGEVVLALTVVGDSRRSAGPRRSRRSNTHRCDSSMARFMVWRRAVRRCG